MEILKLNKVNSGYGRVEIIKKISFKVYKGEFIGIIGPNGAGKSTLLNTITRIIEPFSGNIYIKNKELKQYKYKELAKVVSCVRQESFFSFPYKVSDIVMMGRFPYQNFIRPYTFNDKNIVNRMLKLTDTDYLSQNLISDLSAGEKQRVIIARALAQEPEILFLDEPTSHLDIGHQIKIFDMLKKLNREKNLTIISVLHDLNLAAEYCDKLILLDKGKLVKFDNPEMVLDYKLLEKIYNTLVVIKQNPISNKPYVILVSQKDKKKNIGASKA